MTEQLAKCLLCDEDAWVSQHGKVGHHRGSNCPLVAACYMTQEQWQKLMARPEPAINPVLLETCHTLIETTKESDLQIYPRTYLAHIKGLAKVIIGLKGEPK